MKDIKIKAKNFRQSIKQNGIKAEIRRIKNYIKYKKTVLDEYEEWRLLNEPNSEELEKQKSYKAVLNTKFTIITADKEIEKKVQDQTYSNFEITVFL